ncbi:helix-turn-helix domain-containing protein, partial [Nonomuraea sp. RK-328]|nr:helix-turn-helix domain-containing protein [Nonomuraea sp. RK-328]
MSSDQWPEQRENSFDGRAFFTGGATTRKEVPAIASMRGPGPAWTPDEDTFHQVRGFQPVCGVELTLGALLRGWRERALLTQEQLAEKAGLNVRTVRRLETGALLQPRARSILLLAKALELAPGERAALAAATREVPASARGVSASAPGLPSPSGRDEPAAVTVPRQLPADVAALVGRERELAVLERHRSANTVTVVSLDGMAGTGKTALAVHVAHRLAPRFPDGQLFVDLHGHARTAPVEPGEALGRVLRTLGVPGAHIPAHVDDRAALYRSVLADRQVLIVLDDAADEHQVHPLLPAGPDCRVIVTSRRRLTCPGETLSLETLPVAKAVALFTRMAGRERVMEAPLNVLAEVVQRCGLLPLAIRIAAVRLRAHPAWSVRHLLDRLADDRLAELKAGRHSVTAALDVSYGRLPPDQRRAYRLLGARTSADFGVDAAAAVLDTTELQARRLLDQLSDVHLLQEPAPSRYRLHDLVRDHASAVHAGGPGRREGEDHDAS